MFLLLESFSIFDRFRVCSPRDHLVGDHPHFYHPNLNNILGEFLRNIYFCGPWVTLKFKNGPFYHPQLLR